MPLRASVKRVSVFRLVLFWCAASARAGYDSRPVAPLPSGRLDATAPVRGKRVRARFGRAPCRAREDRGGFAPEARTETAVQPFAEISAATSGERAGDARVAHLLVAESGRQRCAGERQRELVAQCVE